MSMVETITQLIENAIGVSAQTLPATTVERAILRRIHAKELSDHPHYEALLRASPQELQALVEEIVVPETWFFRDPKAYELLVQDAQDWLGKHPSQTYRVLSVPCSTGEEPYTIAMACIDADIPLNRVHIDAIDVSERALGIAQHGVYGANSFRSKNLDFRERHFTPTGMHSQIHSDLRRAVHFKQANLLDPTTFSNVASYNAMLCRNLLIYFDKDAKQRAYAVFHTLLKPGGLLFVGHAEASMDLAARFQNTGVPMAFAYRNIPPAARKSVPPPARPVVAAGPSKLSARSTAPATRPQAKPVSAPQPITATQPDAPSLQAINQLADAGKLHEATVACERHVQQCGPNAENLSLLGLLHLAMGNTAEARSLLGKALYLSPDNEEALFHLAILADQTGDTATAHRYRDRAQRIQQRRQAGA